jgi:hypothetical protein
MSLPARMNRFAAMAVATALAACASGPPFTGVVPAQPDQTVVYFYRSAGIMGAAIEHELVVDGKPAGRLVNGSYLRVALPAPSLTDDFMRIHVGNCDRMRQTPIRRGGSTYFVKVEVNNNTVTVGQQIRYGVTCDVLLRTQEQALPEMASLHAPWAKP